MIKFQLDSPFHQKDIDNEIKSIEKQVEANFSRNRNYGFLALSLLLILIHFMGLDFTNKDTDAYKFCLYFIISLFVTIMLFFPIFLKSSNIYPLYFNSYLIATGDKLHNCHAFINMPGMEEYKDYVESVRQQGRELTNFECDEIIKYWNSLI